MMDTIDDIFLGGWADTVRSALNEAPDIEALLIRTKDSDGDAGFYLVRHSGVTGDPDVIIPYLRTVVHLDGRKPVDDDEAGQWAAAMLMEVAEAQQKRLRPMVIFRIRAAGVDLRSGPITNDPNFN